MAAPTDAVIALGPLTSQDPRDEKQSQTKAKPLQDYTPTERLKKDGLKGKRIGWFKAAFGNHATTDSLTVKAMIILRCSRHREQKL